MSRLPGSGTRPFSANPNALYCRAGCVCSTRENSPQSPVGWKIDIASSESPISPQGPLKANWEAAQARFGIGDIVKHRLFPFRGVIFDVDPEFSNTEEWWEAIPEDVRPRKDQPFYHLLAENEDSAYVAYVSQQNLLPDDDAEPIRHPAIDQIFGAFRNGRYILKPSVRN